MSIELDTIADLKAQLLGATASNEGLRKELEGARLHGEQCLGVMDAARREIKAAHECIDEAGGIPNRDPKVGELTLLQRVRMLSDDMGVMERACSRRGAGLIIATERAENAEAQLSACTALLEERTRERDELQAELTAAEEVGDRQRERAKAAECSLAAATSRAASLESENAGLRERVRKLRIFVDWVAGKLMPHPYGYGDWDFSDIAKGAQALVDELDDSAALSDAPPAAEYRAEDDERLCVTCGMPGNCHVDSPLNRDHVYAPPAATVEQTGAMFTEYDMMMNIVDAARWHAKYHRTGKEDGCPVCVSVLSLADCAPPASKAKPHCGDCNQDIVVSVAGWTCACGTTEPSDGE